MRRVIRAINLVLFGLKVSVYLTEYSFEKISNHLFLHIVLCSVYLKHVIMNASYL